MAKARIVSAVRLGADQLEQLARVGGRRRRLRRGATAPSSRPRCADAEGLLVDSHVAGRRVRCSRSRPHLRVISTVSVGFDHIAGRRAATRGHHGHHTRRCSPTRSPISPSALDDSWSPAGCAKRSTTWARVSGATRLLGTDVRGKTLLHRRASVASAARSRARALAFKMQVCAFDARARRSRDGRASSWSRRWPTASARPTSSRCTSISTRRPATCSTPAAFALDEADRHRDQHVARRRDRPGRAHARRSPKAASPAPGLDVLEVEPPAAGRSAARDAERRRAPAHRLGHGRDPPRDARLRDRQPRRVPTRRALRNVLVVLRPTSPRDRAAAGLRPGLALLDVEVVGEAEQPFGDDVVQHLARAAADRERGTEEEAAVPLARRASPFSSSMPPAPMRSLASVNTRLPCGSASALRSDASGPGFLFDRGRDHPHAVVAQDLAFDERADDLLARDDGRRGRRCRGSARRDRARSVRSPTGARRPSTARPARSRAWSWPCPSPGSPRRSGSRPGRARR